MMEKEIRIKGIIDSALSNRDKILHKARFKVRHSLHEEIDGTAPAKRIWDAALEASDIIIMELVERIARET